ncbi:hypothetical protein DFQ28_011039 [Apophysomyces sp. BC1034]|nr:hypothetical protein DFQ30_010774 [Apophysomyces sp. BC1015]KAG0184498.1 hypothetical protein DFQ28_011039 [Apophysomyces sp. BC1034]
MGFVDKIKAQVEMWRIEKYTKRRPVTTPDFEQKDREFYDKHYQNGVYTHQQKDEPSGLTRNSSLIKTSNLLRKKSERIVRSSENYNMSQQ